MSCWNRVALGELAESVDYGVTASASNVPSGPKFLRITDIQDNSVDWDLVPWCECDARNADESQLRSGDIVFARTGATTGKSYLINQCPKNTVFASYLIRVRMGGDVEPRYVSHFFQTADYWAQITKSARGAAQPGVNATTLKALQIPLPPLPEQRRIAAILDQADALRTKRREALALLDSLTQSIFIEMFGDPSAETALFEKYPLHELVEDGFQNGAYFSKESYVENGVEMVHMSDAFGGIIKRGNLKRVLCNQSDIEKYSLTIDDIIIARRSLTYDGAARPCMVPKENESLIFESSFIRVRADRKRVTPLFLFHYLNNDRVRKKFVRPYVTQSTISGINQSNLAQVPVVVPPVELQHEFNTRFAAVESVRKGFTESQIELDALFASLQHSAFRGEL